MRTSETMLAITVSQSDTLCESAADVTAELATCQRELEAWAERAELAGYRLRGVWGVCSPHTLPARWEVTAVLTGPLPDLSAEEPRHA